MKGDYPRIKELGITVYEKPVPHVNSAELAQALGDKKEQFHDLFGIQTCSVDGPYPWDVEAVLERMKTGKLTGTQKDWD